MKTLIIVLLCATSLFAQNKIRKGQISSSDQHGTDSKLQTSDGTGTNGHVASFNSGGGLTDLSPSVTVNGTTCTLGSTCSPSGAGGITALTGDVTASGPGSSAATVAKVNGIAYSATAAAHTVEVITTANTTATAKVLPDCTDTSGNHLNYTQSTDAFSCGTSSTAATHGFSASFGSTASGATALTTSQTVYTTTPAGFTISECDIAVSPADTATFKVWRVATGGTSLPTSGNSLNTSGIAISTGAVLQTTTLTDFSSLVFAAKDIIAITITAVGGTATYANFNCHN